MCIDKLVPMTLEERMQLRKALRDFVRKLDLCPPVSLKQLEELASDFVSHHDSSLACREWLMVEIHNCVWEDTVASIPYDRRLLLLPKCLSHSKLCQGEVDELGLLCHRCGHCTLPDLQDYAEQMGVMSIVAEGFTSVIELIENQVVDAVIGVSCLDSLEKAFPLLVNHAVPGMAIPLNVSGCRDTKVDESYVKRLLTMHSDRSVQLLNYERIREQMNAWFTREALLSYFPSDDATSQMAVQWLLSGGNRWRPFLLTAVYQALTGDETVPEEVHLAALAVECFHKASLVHDDIQDADTMRYGKPTVYAEQGVAVAINVGDYLLGMGYRLLARCGQPDLIQVIAEAHLDLCVGQGTELLWTNGQRASHLTLDEVIDIFRHKTVPAFQVALELGLICAGGGKSPVRSVLKAYSEALGISYQLNDDLADDLSDNVVSSRPSALFAHQSAHPELTHDQVLRDLKALAERYHQDALNVLGKIQNLELKRLLFLVTEKINSKSTQR